MITSKRKLFALGPEQFGVGGGYSNTPQEDEIAWSSGYASDVHVLNGRPSTFAANNNYSRAGTKWADDASGNWASFAANVPPITDKGILIEPAATNGIRTPDMAGAAAPSTWPTNWPAPYVGGGLTLQIISVGTLKGLPSLRCRLFGTVTSNNGAYIYFEDTTHDPAVLGQPKTFSLFMALVAGLGTGITGLNFIRHYGTERQVGGGATSVAGEMYGVDFKASLTTTALRTTTTYTPQRTGVAWMQKQLEFGYSNGALVDMYFDLAAPQDEDGLKATSPIKGTRSADALVQKLPSRPARNMKDTFSDNTSQTIAAVPGGDYAVPTNLNGATLKSAVWRSV